MKSRFISIRTSKAPTGVRRPGLLQPGDRSIQLTRPVDFLRFCADCPRSSAG